MREPPYFCPSVEVGGPGTARLNQPKISELGGDFFRGLCCISEQHVSVFVEEHRILDIRVT